MEAILVSVGVVAFAEIGDKTQLLAVLLAARFQKPLPVILGILAATILNHLIAATLGTLAADRLTPDVLRWILAVSFLAMGVWTLIPDRLDGEPKLFENFGAFGATLFSFFLVEIGDKTQIATLALAARFHSIVPVAFGTTLGMMIADAPAVYLGKIAATRLPLKPLRLIAAGIFLLLGLAAVFDLGSRFGLG
jgi:putative Ca2+/H+ antiporter (TMEM165/GDT1 family)